MTWEEASTFTWEDLNSLTWYQASFDKSKLLEQLLNGEIMLSESATKKLVKLCGEVVTKYNAIEDEKILFVPQKEKLSLKDKISIIQMMFSIIDKAIQNEVLMESLKNGLNCFIDFLKNLDT